MTDEQAAEMLALLRRIEEQGKRLEALIRQTPSADAISRTMRQPSPSGAMRRP